ncbi:hypothetical protein [Actinoplanes sp. HUAS TT8]|uniref:hypothetical protein n=1 Tax=Actinoplanes sp. HUAS TT8 TaxID=3447453 RepID=UPI003F5281BD
MDEWISKLDQLLAEPFVMDNRGRPEPHHVDLRESQSFYDWETEDGDFDLALTSFEADRAQLAQVLTYRYGPPERRDIRPYFDGEASPDARAPRCSSI